MSRNARGVVKMPTISTQETTTEEFLVAFYRALGWTGTENLVARKVLINKGDWLRICEDLKKNDREAALMMMQYGPSGREEIPAGKVRLEKGWLAA